MFPAFYDSQALELLLIGSPIGFFSDKRRLMDSPKDPLVWVFPKIGGKHLKWMVYNIMENPMNKWMIWRYHYFWKHPYSPKDPFGLYVRRENFPGFP